MLAPSTARPSSRQLQRRRIPLVTSTVGGGRILRPLAALSGSNSGGSGSSGHSSGGGSYHDTSEAGRHHDTQDELQVARAEQQQEAQQQIEEAEYSLQTLEAAAATNAHPQAREVSVAAPGPLDAARQALRSNPAVAVAAYAAVGFLGVTFLITLGRMALKYLDPKAKKQRNVNKNKLVIDEVRQFLPGNRAGLTSAAMGRLRFKTGFTATEVFRKYLWYLLRERSFDQEAVDDLVALKAALGLKDEEVAAALKERAERIYDKYGNVMLETEGMTKSGIERKATTRALFSKLQYLLDYAALLSSPAAETVSLRDIFGATEQDVARLRIVSLHDVDLEALASLPTVEGMDGGSGGKAGGETAQ